MLKEGARQTEKNVIMLNQRIPLESVLSLQRKLVECPDENFDALNSQYLASLVQLATVVNYRVKSISCIPR
jgi:hypothetical protein